MSDHSRAFVPIESWCYSSPELRSAGKSADIGLLAESLIYYDSILLNITDCTQFDELFQWLVFQQQLPNFLTLLSDGTITLYDYSFLTTAIKHEGSHSVWNIIIQDSAHTQAHTFTQRFLYRPILETIISDTKQRRELYSLTRKQVIEVKADDFGAAVENARADYLNSRRNRLIVQALVDELYSFKSFGRPPEVEVRMIPNLNVAGYDITWNIDFLKLGLYSGLSIDPSAPLVAGALCNRFLWSAAQQKCDLFLGQPMSFLVGDKLYETVKTPSKSNEIITTLKDRVEFPDVRALVNQGKLGLAEVLELRKKAVRFRSWLQSEAERDRDAIIAYHNEVAKEAGYTKVGRKALNLFGILGGGAVGGAIGASFAGPIGGAVGGTAGSAVTYLSDLGSKLNAEWKPVIFGNWMSDRIATMLKNCEGE